jgi:imidazolonepropionase-like amidohydrolase
MNPMKTILTIVLLTAGTICQAQQPVSSANRQIVFQDVNVVTLNTGKVQQHQTIVVKNGRIISKGLSREIKYDKNALVVNAARKFVIPGLAEMHAHVPQGDDLEPMKEVLMLFVLNGITTIRGMLGHPKHLELRQKIRTGEIPGPHFYTTGPSFNGTSVKSPEEGSAMVRQQKEAGYDYLKLHPGLTRENFDAIAATAKEVGIPFAGHVSYDVGVWHAIESGYSTIDHLDGFIEGMVPGIEKIPEQRAGLFGMYVADQADASAIPRLLKALKANNVWVVPTQALAERWFHPDYSAEDFKNDPHRVYMNPKTVDQWVASKDNLVNSTEYSAAEIRKFVEFRRDLILKCQTNGVGLLLGCDAPQIFNVPGFSTHEELEYLVRAGLTPAEALRTGTVNVAKYLRQNDAGVIKEGAVSDLILLDANPLADIKNTRQIAGVMLGDKWMDKKYIDAQLKKLVKK